MSLTRPMINRDSQFFWDGTAVGELRIQKCNACGSLRHPPGPSCPDCGAFDRGHVVASGRGTVFSYVVHRHPPVPGKELPIVIVAGRARRGTCGCSASSSASTPTTSRSADRDVAQVDFDRSTTT